MFSGSGMAVGGWLAGATYDYAGFYAVAFATGILLNLANLMIVSSLVLRQSRQHSSVFVQAQMRGIRDLSNPSARSLL